MYTKNNKPEKMKSSFAGYLTIPALLMSLFGLLALACGSLSELLPTPTPALALKGKFILEKVERNKLQYVSSTYYEFQTGWKKPREIANPLPANLPPGAEILAVSPDKQYFVLAPTSLFSVRDGKSLQLKDSSRISLAFSSDGKHLAFQVPGEVWVRDLDTGEDTKIFTSDCADYIGGGERCENVGAPAWVDANTLIFPHHEGLPSSFKFGSEDDPDNLNSISIVDYQGNPVFSGGGKASEGYLTQGETVFGYHSTFDDPEADSWLDTTLLSRGIYAPQSLCPPEFSIDCFYFKIPLTTASPDGSKILAHFYDFDKKEASYWYLLEVKTKKITKLGTPTSRNETTEGPCLWSPDGTSVACIAQVTNEYDIHMRVIHVIPLSQEAGQFVAILPGDSSVFEWKLLEWQP